MSHRLTRRTWAALGILLVAIPALMAVFVCVWDERKYYLTSLLLVGLMFVPFVLRFEGRRPQARELVLLATMTALAVAGRAAFYWLPQCKPVCAIVILTAVAFTPEAGFVTGAAREVLAGVDTLLLEANHDVETLQYGPYPYFLKRRILGDEGHLSNDAAAEFARLAVQSGTRDILLAHLSKENNTPELAEYAVARALQSAGLSVRLGVAPRDTMSEVHLCRRSPSFASAN